MRAPVTWGPNNNTKRKRDSVGNFFEFIRVKYADYCTKISAKNGKTSDMSMRKPQARRKEEFVMTRGDGDIRMMI